MLGAVWLARLPEPSFIVIGTTAPVAAEELIGLASIGEPGVCEAMLQSAGFVVDERATSYAIIEGADEHDVWKAVRSPGVALPSLQHVGEDEMRRRVLDVAAPFRADDGSSRLVNELTDVTARLPG